MTVRGRLNGRRPLAAVTAVSALTAAVVLAVLGLPATGTGSAWRAEPPLEAGDWAGGPPAGEADDLTDAPPWWRSAWPRAVGADPAVETDGRSDASGTGPGPDPGGPFAAGAPQTAPRTGAPEAGSSATVPPPPVHDAEPVREAEVDRRSKEGFEVSGGTSERGSGPVVTYTVELEPAVDDDLLALTAAVEEALYDPRSWSRDHTLRRVEDPASASIRVLLATPGTVDRLCAEAGLDTQGRYSCWNGTFAALHAGRWRYGAPDFDELTTYRRYLVNHEFGHGLGHGHVDCPAPGAPAPVMMQQTISTGGCEANGWPYPDAPVD